MTLPEITYSLLEVIREANIVDDERIDMRLLEKFTASARADSIVGYLNASKPPLEGTLQYIDVVMDTVADGDNTIVKSTSTIPEPIDTRFGLCIFEVYPTDDMLAIPFSPVEFNRLRYCGSNKFNKSHIFISYRNGYLYAKASDDNHLLLENITAKVIVNDPTEVSGFDKETDQYPIDEFTFQYIKDRVLKTDIRLLMSGLSDEVNDSTGDIQAK